MNSQLPHLLSTGINEAGASKKYKDFVNDQWHTFDMVIVVLDGRQGVNTEEQIALLKLVKTNCDKTRKVPVAILMNKIDDPDDEEQQTLVKEARHEVEKIFEVNDRSKSLQLFLAGKVKNRSLASPSFIAISGIHAFIFRTAKNLDFASFKKKIDKSQMDKIGREAYPVRRWKNFTVTEKQKKAYEVLCDPDQVADGLEACNFDKCLSILDFFLGGEERQKKIIEEQIRISKNRLAPEVDYVTELVAVFHKSERFGRETSFVFTSFKDVFARSVENAFQAFTDPKNVLQLSKPMQEMISFFDFVIVYMSDSDEIRNECLTMAKDIVLKLIDLVLSGKGACQSAKPEDLMVIYGKLLGIVRGDFFDEHFGMARILLEAKFQRLVSSEDRGFSSCRQHLCTHGNSNSMRNCTQRGSLFYCGTCNVAYGANAMSNFCSYCSAMYATSHTCAHGERCSYCGYTDKALPVPSLALDHKIEGGKIKIANSSTICINVPEADSPADPNHFGHLLWSYERLVRKAQHSEKKFRKGSDPNVEMPPNKKIIKIES